MGYSQQVVSALCGSDVVLSSEAGRFIGEQRCCHLQHALLQHVQESRDYGKTSSIHALALLQDEIAIPVLKKLIEEPNVPDDAYWYGHRAVRAAAAVALLHFDAHCGEDYLRGLAEKNHQVCCVLRVSTSWMIF